MKQIKQQEIAERLNLSRATVSRCFTNHKGINPETRARVFEEASQLGYHHLSSRVVKSDEKTTTLGVLICNDVDDSETTEYESPWRNLLKGISEYSQIKGIDLSIHFIDPTAKSIDSKSYRDLLNHHGKDWDGILLLYPFPKDVLDALSLKFPCVSLVEQRSKNHHNCVDVDHYQGIALLVNHLFELGHSRISFYSKKYKLLQSWSLKRAGAYFAKMTQLGLDFDQDQMINVHPDRMVPLEESFDLAAEQVKNGITAIVCAADHQAYDLINGLRERGIKVPEDVSVTGFDGIEAPDDTLKLCTVKIPNQQIGYFATERVFELLNKRYSPASHTLLGCTLLEGNSVRKL